MNKDKKLIEISKFLKIAKKEGYEMMITRKNIIELEKKYCIERPRWLLNNKKFRIGYGAYSMLRVNKELEIA